MARKSSRGLGDVLGYAEVAERMGVTAKAVATARRRDPEFPEPVTPPSFRSPGWDPEDIDRYITLREVRRAGRSGRPPRSASKDRLPVDAAMNDRIRELIQTKSTMTAIADAIGLSPTAVWFRLQGRSRWARQELEAVSRKVDVPLEQLIEGAPRKPARRPAAKKS